MEMIHMWKVIKMPINQILKINNFDYYYYAQVVLPKHLAFDA